TERPGLPQRSRAGVERRAGREDIVDDENVAAGDARGRPERSANVCAAFRGREVALRSGGPDAREPPWPDRHLEPPADPPGQQGGLIEPALPLTLARERYRDQRLDSVGQRRETLLDRELAERTARARRPENFRAWSASRSWPSYTAADRAYA